jgi:predicted 3-demethylubiquinone-9 3-methyltransferase (glyoxalase superfamily)
MSVTSKITPSLWFPGTAEEASGFYTSIFPSSSIQNIERYTSAGQDKHGMPVGSVMIVEFVLNGTSFKAINGPPIFEFTPAISFSIDCEDQAEVDHYWSKLGEGGEPGPCGWMKDKFGLSWQVVPKQLAELMKSGNEKQKTAVNKAMMGMGKLDIEGFKKAHKGLESQELSTPNLD